MLPTVRVITQRFSASTLRTFTTASALRMPIKVGEKLPSVEVMEGTPNDKVNVAEIFAGKKGVLIGVPGAFSGTCQKTHLAGYLEHFDKIKSKGVDVIACVAVNDPFVMDAWGKATNATGKIRMLADAGGDFARAIDCETPHIGAFGGKRCKRFSMVVENGVVKTINVEPEAGTGATCSLAPEIMSDI